MTAALSTRRAHVNSLRQQLGSKPLRFRAAPPQNPKPPFPPLSTSPSSLGAPPLERGVLGALPGTIPGGLQPPSSPWGSSAAINPRPDPPGPNKAGDALLSSAAPASRCGLCNYSSLSSPAPRSHQTRPCHLHALSNHSPVARGGNFGHPPAWCQALSALPCPPNLPETRQHPTSARRAWHQHVMLS